MRPNILFLLILTGLSIDFVATMRCPTPVVDDIGEYYDTNGRFNRIINQVGNTLSTTFVHHRHKDELKGDEYKYVLNFCGKENGTAVTQIEKVKKNVQ